MKMPPRVAVMLLCGAISASLHAQPAPTPWRVVEQWRVDGTESGEPFGSVRDVAIGKDGSLWVLDFKDQMIRRFDANGKPLKTVGRKGKGPGEMMNANGLVVAKDGSVWVNDPSNARLSIFTGNGEFSRQIVLTIFGYGYRWDAFADATSGDVYDQTLIRRSGSTNTTMEWRRLSSNGVVLDTVAMPECNNPGQAPTSFYSAKSKNGNMNGAYPFSQRMLRVPNRAGGVWCAGGGAEGAALVRIGKGDTIARTNLTLSAIAVDRADRDSAIAQVQKQLAKYETNTFDASKVPNSKQPIASLAVDDDGRLWVQHADRVNDKGVTFDVHDKAGKNIGRVVIPRLLAQEQIPVRARGNDLWVAVRDADDVVNIVKYRISR